MSAGNRLGESQESPGRNSCELSYVPGTVLPIAWCVRSGGATAVDQSDHREMSPRCKEQRSFATLRSYAQMMEKEGCIAQTCIGELRSLRNLAVQKLASDPSPEYGETRLWLREEDKTVAHYR